MHELLSRLTGGDRRSIGRSNEVVAAVLGDPSLFGVLFSGLWSSDPLIRMRTADALEKITVKHPEWLHPYKEQLIGQVAQSQEQEVRWHMAQMFPRLQTNQEERAAMVGILLDYLGDRSRIVRTFAMQALADLAEQDADLRPEVIRVLEEQTRIGSLAMQSRGRKLLGQLATARIREGSSP
jgi:HEAT repeat protein